MAVSERHSPHPNVRDAILLALCLATFVAMASYAQANGETQVSADASSASNDPANLSYRLKGQDIPRYYLVQNFLLIAYGRSDDDKLFDHLLAELGLAFGTENSAVVERRLLVESTDGPGVAVNRVQYGSGHRSTMTAKSETEFREHARAKHAQEARALADIYVDLLNEVAEQGASTEGIDRYIHDNLAHATSLSSDEPLEKPRYYVLAFEEQMEKRGRGPVVE